jgi:predicted Zn-ribbon and HTH transcriptional regulator
MTVKKPNSKENEYFMNINLEKSNKIRKELNQARAKEEKMKCKEAHWMKCPKCGFDLKEVNLQNVMIDKCDECKGIWLDAGELDLLIKGQARFTQIFINKLFV